MEMSQPAVFMFMNAWHPNVDGKRYENHFQNCGNANVGHENPVRNSSTGDMKRSNTNTDSLLVMNVLHAEQKNTQSVTKNIKSTTMSRYEPLCGKPHNAGTMHAIYMPNPMNSSQ